MGSYSPYLGIPFPVSPPHMETNSVGTRHFWRISVRNVCNTVMIEPFVSWKLWGAYLLHFYATDKYFPDLSVSIGSKKMISYLLAVL
jgi:hypothetical protein